MRCMCNRKMCPGSRPLVGAEEVGLYELVSFKNILFPVLKIRAGSGVRIALALLSWPVLTMKFKHVHTLHGGGRSGVQATWVRKYSFIICIVVMCYGINIKRGWRQSFFFLCKKCVDFNILYCSTLKSFKIGPQQEQHWH